tara:strand:+ start:189 stop:683 length:495 start_codon:yes stop_codon:yes gene_type:complete
MALPVLHEIAKDYSDALEELSDMADDEAVVDTLDALKGTLEQKSENIIKYTQNLEGTIEAMKNAEKNMAERRKVLEKRATDIKKYVKNVMDSNEITQIETVHFALKIKKNPPKAVIENPDLIPSSYFNTQVVEKVNLKKVKDDLKNGEIVEGAKLVQETRLDIS